MIAGIARRLSSWFGVQGQFQRATVQTARWALRSVAPQEPSAMKRSPLYSAPRRPKTPPASPDVAAAAPAAPAAAASSPAAQASQAPTSRRRRALRATALLALLVAAVALWRFGPGLLPKPLTQRDIDRAVLHTLSKTPLPAPAAKAYASVRGSVVRVIGYSRPELADAAPGKEKDKDNREKDKAEPKSAKPRPFVGPEQDDEDERGVGTGVVIIDNGTILTNLHVVHGARRIKVVFADGLESDADIVGLQPQHDLAVLKARRIPDDLQAATMRSTGDLSPGDRVTAVGFPFGIGPSVSHGVVSGLKREFRSPEGQRILTNLIQFDAAANPGNSGGPLVTDDGEVVGIVTAIYNPTQERFFVGIGFAVPIENAAQAAGMPPF
jgi:serine protease DegQ